MADDHAANRLRDFRLNLEQQQKRAKELLKSARAGEPAALARFGSRPPRLAEAQFLIARDLRFDSWAALKRHVTGMALARRSMGASVPDGDLRTLHMRCGADLKVPLRTAGFGGDFYEHSYPYLIGPVREGADCLRQRARFIVDSYGEMFDPPWDARDPELLEQQVRGLEEAERVLRQASQYDRVVVWSEHDCYDQLTLIRLLAHFATHPRPARLELITVGDFPGARRFIGLGELPPEALRLLWATRKAPAAAQLALGLDAWRALANPDPRPLAAIMRSGTPALPLLAPALHRHLRELPSSVTGLSLTEELALALLARKPHSLERMFWAMAYSADPLPGQGDWSVRRRVLDMEAAQERVYTRTPGRDGEGRSRPPWTDVFEITPLGRAVLAGEADFRSLRPPRRWVGGVEIVAGNPDWRWEERSREAVRPR
ncbi:MAG TPA: DUF1835 domain-containing protein [Steroidobacteraceae bacterium]|nr:DUF1835 domain-containing protein [Steroidobacteraceae bacterium]